MLHNIKRLGLPALGAILLALVSLAPAAAQGIYGGYGGSYGGGTGGSAYGGSRGNPYMMPMAPYGPMGGYGSTYGSGRGSYSSSYGQYGGRYGNAYGSAFYRIRFGDTLSRIAARFGTTVWALLIANPRIMNRDLIFAGQTLRIPMGRRYGYAANTYAAPSSGYAAPRSGYAAPSSGYAAPMQPMPAPQPTTPPPAPMPGQQTVTVTLTAHNIAFNMSSITVPAGARVVVHFTNQDAVPHNLAVYTDKTAQQTIFRGQVITGPNASVTYQFDAPSQPGTYFFRCDVHPAQINGPFVVQ